MTEARANKIFRTKYPEGEITRKNASSAGWKYFVVFNKGGKVYYYSCASYAELLNRFGFEVVYKHDLISAEETLKKYEQQLEDAKEGKFSMFAFIFTEQTPETEKAEIENLQTQVDTYKELVRCYTEDYIID